MKMLIEQIDLDSKKSRDYIPLECYQCYKTHYRTKNVVLRILNGNLKNTKKGCFCSQKCECEYKKIPKIVCQCEQCSKQFERLSSEIKKHTFCSSSCSATFFNKTKILSKKCLHCLKDFHPYRGGNRSKYCSVLCSSNQKRKLCYDEIEQGKVNGHSRSTLRSYLKLKRGNKCQLCGITEWQNLPLVVILDHINGNSDDNSMENLRLICSNCDANLPTYKSKNRGNGREYRRKKKLEPLVGVEPT